MELTSRRKDIIKNIAIIFLIVMLVLTFFSSTIMNRSLPEVAAQYAYSGQITTSVRANGTTQANENYQVIIEEGRVIQEINVRRGDKVAVDDILFVLEESESAEMQEAQDTLKEAEKAYDKWKLQVEADIADRERNIRYETQDLADIKKKGVNAKTDTSEAEAAIKDLEKLLGSYTLKLATLVLERTEKAKDAAELAAENAADDYDAKNEIYQELRNNSPDTSMDAKEQQLLNAARNIEDKEIALARATAEYDAVCVEHNTALENREKLLKALNLAKANSYDNSGSISMVKDNIAMYQAEVERLSSLPNRTEEEEIELSNARGQLAYYQAMLSNASQSDAIVAEKLAKAQAAYDENETKIAQYEEQMKSMEQDLEDQNRVLARDKEDYAALKAEIDAFVPMDKQEYNAALKQAQEDVKAAEKIKEDKDELFGDAQSDYSEAKANYDAAKKNGKKIDGKYTEAQLLQLIEETEEQLTEAKEHLEDLQKEQDTDGYPSYEAYKEAITAKERSIEELKTALSRKQDENKLDEPAYKEAIARARKEVKRLSESVGSSVIKAKVAGTVNNIAVTAGQKVEAQTVLLELEQQDKGYSVVLSMTTEQSKRISVGQAATILYYWGDTPEATVTSIKPSKSDPQNTREVTLNLIGDITAGQSFTFSLGERSANYDTVVPNSAIREDSNGKFVLVVEAKTTPIGNRYTAVRRDVEVIAEDEVNTAVSGLTGGEFVITTSTTPITQGQQVRLSDN